MKTVIMTSDKFEGSITFQYNENNKLDQLMVQAILTPEQQKWLGQNLPWELYMMAHLSEKAKGARLVYTDREITFEMMWDLYNDKQRSSKKKSRKKWDSMTKENQVKAYLYYPRYMRSKGNAEKKYLETYLNAELWNN